MGACWCGQSYFVDSDGGAAWFPAVGVWLKSLKVQTSPKPGLTLASTSPFMPGGQFPGFFTSISSNGTSNPIIWALSRPSSSTSTKIFLYALNPDAGGTTMTQLFKAAAGAWPNYGGDANIVPVVANGQVFVASEKQLQIFGLKAGKNIATK